MSNMADFEDLLAKARNGAPKSLFTQHMPEIMDISGFQNETQLRLLGNSIANCPENAAMLSRNKEAMNRLFLSGKLGISVLFNGTVNNREFSEAVLGILVDSDRPIENSEEMRSLLGSIWDTCRSCFSRDIMIKLAIDGYVELILMDHSLETDPTILANFKKIYDHCQAITIDAQDDDELDARGFRVVGNISSHPNFTLEIAKDIGQTPFTWDTVILLSNLTAKKADIEPVLAKWPNLVKDTLILIEQEDPDAFKETDLNESAGQYEDVDLEPESAFDLELWGTLLRNVSRNKAAAEQVSQANPCRLFERLYTFAGTKKIAVEFAIAFCQNRYDHDLARAVTRLPFNRDSVMMASAILDGFKLELPPVDELNWIVLRISSVIAQVMLSDDSEAVWVKGSRSLAMICADYGLADRETIKKLMQSDAAKRNEQALENLDRIQYM